MLIQLDQIQKKETEEYQNCVTSKPIVSVCIQTYQHVAYIRQCLESVLMQKIACEYEILLGEDESTDGTREICLEYAEKYPEKIRLFLHNRENVIFINGQASGRFNLLYNLSNARGKYIALLEGDDYWTDPEKLQKQVKFLKNNLDYIICFHPVMIEKEHKKFTDYITRDVDLRTNTLDLAAGNYIHTVSVMFRNINFQNFPKMFFKTFIGDLPLYLYLSQYGDVRKLEFTGAVYRVHAKGRWSLISAVEKIDKTIRCLEFLLNYFSTKKDVFNVLFYNWRNLNRERFKDISLCPGKSSIKELIKYYNYIIITNN
ncbi:MAG: glycosyltransferase family 2 protein [Candidatus Peribacteraceae bacterium]|nr:glycosyltransferase family 2 protein [Candidatus Peribacteraceae bacterium]